MAPYDIPPGSEYAEVIYDALNNSAYLVLMLSDFSQNSQWVKKEVNIAITNGKTVIPVKLEELELNSSMKFYLNDQQIVPVRVIEESSGEIQSVLNSVIALTGKGTKPSTTNKVNNYTAEQNKNTVVAEVNNSSQSFERIFYTNGDVYEGGIVNDMRNGKGKYTWADGDVYEGDFVDGEIKTVDF